MKLLILLSKVWVPDKHFDGSDAFAYIDHLVYIFHPESKSDLYLRQNLLS